MGTAKGGGRGTGAPSGGFGNGPPAIGGCGGGGTAPLAPFFLPFLPLPPDAPLGAVGAGRWAASLAARAALLSSALCRGYWARSDSNVTLPGPAGARPREWDRPRPPAPSLGARARFLRPPGSTTALASSANCDIRRFLPPLLASRARCRASSSSLRPGTSRSIFARCVSSRARDLPRVRPKSAASGTGTYIRWHSKMPVRGSRDPTISKVPKRLAP